jgi:hypothetical protein
VAFVGRQLPLQEAAALARLQAAPTLGALGIAGPARELMATLHLLELLVRHEEARSSTASADSRFYPAVSALLERSLGAGGRESEPSRGRAA